MMRKRKRFLAMLCATALLLMSLTAALPVYAEEGGEQPAPEAPAAEAEPAPEQPSNPAPEQPSNPAPEQPSNPAPEQPSNPAPENPAPEQPSNPAPEQPSNPAPEQPSNPAPENPAPEQPSNPAPENPAPENPAPEQPAPENPAPENPAPEQPAPENPAPENPAPENPAPENPTPENPEPENPAPENPAPENPEPENPAPENPEPENPAPENPTSEQPENPAPEDGTGEGGEPTEEPPVDPELLEPTEEPEPEPLPPVELGGLNASAGEVSPGTNVHFSFSVANAQSVTWHAWRSDGLDSGSGGADGGEFDWTPGVSGIYTIEVNAVGEDLSSETQRTQVIARAGALVATANAATNYAKVGEKDLLYDVSVSGGVEPYAVTIIIEYNGGTIYKNTSLTPRVDCAPAGYGDHILHIYVADAIGAAAEASALITASDNILDEAPPLPHLSDDMTFAERLVAVAKSQVGYRESIHNFVWQDWEKRKPQGWTVYGAWYGSAYEEWCAMFVAYCLNAAGIPEWMMPRSGNCNRWKEKLGGRYIDNEDEYIPQPGDLIFFHHDRVSKDPNFPNHIGIVIGYDEGSRTVYTVEGNASAGVNYRQYAHSSGVVVGYASMGYCMRRWDRVYKDRMREQLANNKARSNADRKVDAINKRRAKVQTD